MTPQDLRIAAAAPVLEALDTPLLDILRAVPDDPEAWLVALGRPLSHNEHIVLSWLCAAVWADRPGMQSEWAAHHVVTLGLPAHVRAACQQAAADLHRLTWGVTADA